jgi:hypothetical protein
MNNGRMRKLKSQCRMCRKNFSTRRKSIIVTWSRMKGKMTESKLLLQNWKTKKESAPGKGKETSRWRENN